MAILFDHQAMHGEPPLDIGGKARGLARAARAGFVVPRWFVISADGSAEIGADKLAQGLREELATAIATLCPNGERVAVRSSARDEDGAQHSFAGQFESVLDVAPADVEERVRDVWRSGFSARIVAYRREHGLSPLPRRPAVIVQRMVQARVAGVAFSADPISGRRGIAVVGAVRGIGAALVSGEADADTWRVDRRGTIVERRIASEPALTDAEVLAVARLVRDAARRLGQPQDIEWAFEGSRLLLLQARPITTLAALADPDGALTIWDNSNIVESYSGVTKPLTFSFASEIYAHVYRQFCRLMRVPARAVEAHDDVFRNMLGLVRGRLYYNLPNWYRVLALLPGYRINRGFMEQMMGVREPLPPDVAEQIARETEASSRGRISDALHLGVTFVGLLVNYATLDRRVRAFTRLLDDALVAPDPPLDDRRPDELAAHYRELRERLLLKWDAPLVNDFFAMIFYGVLRSLVRKWCGDPLGTLQNDLVGGAGGMVSAEPAIRMHRLARLVAANGALGDVLIAGTLAEIQQAIESVPAFSTEYAAYLDKFGERTVNELKLESATLHDDPLPLLRAVGNLAGQLGNLASQVGDVAGHAAGHADRDGTELEPVTRATGGPTAGAVPVATPGQSLRVEARRRVRAALARHPVRRVVFGWVLRHAQARVRDRENLRLERTRLFGRIRRIMREMGRRFQDLGLLDDAHDIFYLEVDEILALVEGRSTCTNVRALAAIRRKELAHYAETSPPADRFETRGLVYRGNTFRHVATPRSDGGDRPAGLDERNGLGCCPGVARGQVRVVLDPRNVTLERQTILVAEHTDPGWILIFPSAAGLLVERGSLLSHAAIVARELGIPAVVSIPGVTRWLRDGDLVEIDGSSGLVRRLAASAVPRQMEGLPPQAETGGARAE